MVWFLCEFSSIMIRDLVLVMLPFENKLYSSTTFYHGVLVATYHVQYIVGSKCWMQGM